MIRTAPPKAVAPFLLFKYSTSENGNIRFEVVKFLLTHCGWSESVL